MKMNMEQMLFGLLAIAAVAALAGCDAQNPQPSPSRSATPAAIATATAPQPTATGVPDTATPTATAAPPTASPTPTSIVAAQAFLDQDYFRARALDYLRFATQTLSPGNVVNVLAHMEREQLDPEYQAPADAVPVNQWDDIFTKMATLVDTRDFDALYLLNLVLGYRGNPVVPEELWQKVETALKTFKFWYTEPTPEGLIDNSYYWTENHEAIYYTLEYLVGQLFPDEPLSTDGRLGSVHHAEARQKLRRWLDLRARYGFSEWHSNVYYQKDLTPLLTLAEYAQDDDIRTRSSMVLDVLLFDIALHIQRGAFGVTHGRSYKKDKMTSLDEDTWGATKMLFDATEYPYQSTSHADAVLLARAQRYRLPSVIWRVARSGDSFADRERMSIDINEEGPVQTDPVAPEGLSFSDPNDVPVWFGIGALTTWEVVPLTVQTFEQYNLWETESFAPFAGLRTLTGNIPFAQSFAAGIYRFLNFGLLKEVNTYTYRTPDFMLSSAIDYRAGSFGQQYHSWQATFDANALVFTNHPFRPLAMSTDWLDDPETGGYWNGEASMPRSAQLENVAVHIYAPQYPMQNPPPLDYFHYEPYTHAYFPQDHFDEVVQQGNWTFGRFRDGYIALYSYRPAEFLVYDPNVYATNGMVKPFDLVANGGADNVWIVECGRAADSGSFADFRAAILAAHLEVTPLGTENGLSKGYDVVYDSPSRGRITFGWQAPFTVGGTEIPLAQFPRYDDPWSHTEFGSPQITIEDNHVGERLDFDAGTREVYAGS